MAPRRDDTVVVMTAGADLEDWAVETAELVEETTDIRAEEEATGFNRSGETTEAQDCWAVSRLMHRRLRSVRLMRTGWEISTGEIGAATGRWVETIRLRLQKDLVDLAETGVETEDIVNMEDGVRIGCSNWMRC